MDPNRLAVALPVASVQSEHRSGRSVLRYLNVMLPRGSAFDVCAEGVQWCPMPQATWHFRLVKLSGPAGPVRFDYVVAAPPKGFSG